MIAIEPGYGFIVGDTLYSDKDFLDIFIQGLKSSAIKKRRMDRRNDIRRILVKCHEDIKKEKEEEEFDVNVLMGDKPFFDLGFEVEQLTYLITNDPR